MEPISEKNETMICETMINGCTEALEPYKSLSRSASSGPSAIAMGNKVSSQLIDSMF